MCKVRWVYSLLPVLILALSFSSGGCGGKRVEDDDLPAPRARSASVEKREPFGESFDGVIRGKVTLEGAMPTPKELPGIAAKPECKAPDQKENIDQTWLVDGNGGVEDVVIWLSPPKGKYFNLPENLRKRTDTKELLQPHCAFVPHVTSLFPKYFDGKELKPTGQKFEARNNAEFPHNTKWAGDAELNPAGNVTLPPGAKKELKLTPTDRITVNCDIHPWMSARIFTFDHPFHAVTKSDGTFEIRDVPTGLEVVVRAWHEGAGELLEGTAGKKMTFKAGDNSLDLKVPRK